jgi:chaperonin cofactor prefoldin
MSAIVALWLMYNRDFVIDNITVWQFKPSSEVQSIVERAHLKEEGKFYLYASQAEVDEAAAFNSVCQKREEHSAILGCYTARRIYIYDVDNPQLDGIKEVTAAHEMLHAAWDRLSDDERNRLAALLETEYSKIADEALRERMDYYARAQPGERANELHSIIGTEVRNLSPELEQHYAKYFEDRSVVVGLHEKYQSVFTSLDSRAKQIETELSTLKSEIEQMMANYNASVAQLNTDIAAFNSRAQTSGGFSSQSEFNRQRQSLANRVDELATLRETINTKISRYNTLASELQSINSQSQALNQSIDSTLTPAPAF